MGARRRPPEAARRGRGEGKIEHLIEGGSSIEVEKRIAASPSTVFSYLTDPTKFMRWMGASAKLDPRPGGAYRIEVDAGNIAVGEYKEVEPPRRLVMSWGWENHKTVPPGSTTVEITLTPDGTGTILKLRHLGLPTDDDVVTHGQGWAMYADRLASVFKGD